MQRLEIRFGTTVADDSVFLEASNEVDSILSDLLNERETALEKGERPGDANPFRDRRNGIRRETRSALAGSADVFSGGACYHRDVRGGSALVTRLTSRRSKINFNWRSIAFSADANRVLTIFQILRPWSTFSSKSFACIRRFGLWAGVHCAILPSANIFSLPNPRSRSVRGSFIATPDTLSSRMNFGRSVGKTTRVRNCHALFTCLFLLGYVAVWANGLPRWRRFFF